MPYCRYAFLITYKTPPITKCLLLLTLIHTPPALLPTHIYIYIYMGLFTLLLHFFLLKTKNFPPDRGWLPMLRTQAWGPQAWGPQAWGPKLGGWGMVMKKDGER
jgi:hypothetical protein